MSQNIVHRDYFGRTIEVGDVLLGAKPGGKYVDTTFNYVIVVSKTKQLIRVHQYGGLSPDLSKLTTEEVKRSLRNRNGRPAGKAVPHAFIKTTVNVGLTQVEMEECINVNTRVQSSKTADDESCSIFF